MPFRLMNPFIMTKTKSLIRGICMSCRIIQDVFALNAAMLHLQLFRLHMYVYYHETDNEATPNEKEVLKTSGITPPI